MKRMESDETRLGRAWDASRGHALIDFRAGASASSTLWNEKEAALFRLLSMST